MTGINGRVFKITSAGVFTVLHTLVSATEGNNPSGSLVLSTDGKFYGATSSGGTSNAGTIFKVTSTGIFTVLRHLSPVTDGSVPKGNLKIGSDGNFYGLTSTGGANKVGTIFKITAAGIYTVLRHFSMATDGGNSYSSLIIAPVNNLVANPQSITTNEDTKKTLILSGSGGAPLTYTIITNPKQGTLTGSAPNLTYTPKLNYYGSDLFSFTVNMGCLSSAPATVNITIISVNDTPVLAPIGNKTVVKGSLLTFTATATDVDAGQTHTFSLIGAPSGATINATSAVFTWTPTVAGIYTFKVRVTDNGTPVLFDEEQITVTVTNTALANSIGSTNKIMAENGGMKIYPNPARDKITVSWNTQALNQVIITVIDTRGLKVGINKYIMVAHNNVEVNIASLKSGVYILQIQTEHGVQSFKFIKY
jgi:uncharacterized repeat protein (TIGR03803 family)